MGDFVHDLIGVIGATMRGARRPNRRPCAYVPLSRSPRAFWDTHFSGAAVVSSVRFADATIEELTHGSCNGALPLHVKSFVESRALISVYNGMKERHDEATIMSHAIAEALLALHTMDYCDKKAPDAAVENGVRLFTCLVADLTDTEGVTHTARTRVSRKSFMNFSLWFGPPSCPMVACLARIMQQRYFHGVITPAEACARLCAPGEFLARMSSSQCGRLVLSYRQGPAVLHQRVRFELLPGGRGGRFIAGNTAFKTLEGAIRALHVLLGEGASGVPR